MLPDIPPGRAPKPATFGSEIARRDAKVEELTRKGPGGTCKVNLTTDAPLQATSTYAQGNWVAVEDPGGWFRPPDSSSQYSRIVVPYTGPYRISFRASIINYTGGSFICAFGLNGLNGSGGAADNRDGANSGSVGTWLYAHRDDLQLNAGDVLYWETFGTVTYTLAASTFGVPTEVIVKFPG